MKGQNDGKVSRCNLPLLENDSELLFKKEQFSQFLSTKTYLMPY